MRRGYAKRFIPKFLALHVEVQLVTMLGFLGRERSLGLDLVVVFVTKDIAPDVFAVLAGQPGEKAELVAPSEVFCKVRVGHVKLRKAQVQQKIA